MANGGCGTYGRAGCIFPKLTPQGIVFSFFLLMSATHAPILAVSQAGKLQGVVPVCSLIVSLMCNPGCPALSWMLLCSCHVHSANTLRGAGWG